MANFAGFSKNREMRIDIIGDDKTGLATKSAESKFSDLGNAARRAGIMITAAAAGAAIALTALVKSSIAAASDLQETQGKFNVVFRGFRKEAEVLAKELADDYIMSENAAKSYMSTMQDMLKPMGMNTEAATELSSEVVKLAADLASFNNVPVADTLRALRSAMVGEFEPMRQFGTMLSVAKIEAEALARGIIATKDELTPLIKAQLAYTLALENNTDANGDAIRTADSFANQTKRLRADLEDFRSEIGENLLPLATEYVGELNEWIDANGELLAQDISGYLLSTADGLRAVADVLIEVNQGWDNFITILSGQFSERILLDEVEALEKGITRAELLKQRVDALGEMGGLGGPITPVADITPIGELPRTGNVFGITEDSTAGLQELTAKQLLILEEANQDYLDLRLEKQEWEDELAAEEMAAFYAQLDAKSEAEEAFFVAMGQRKQEELLNSIAMEKKHSAVVLNLKQRAFSNAVGFLNLLGQESKAAAIAAIALQKGWAIADTIRHGIVAQAKVTAQLGVLAPPYVAAIQGWTAVNVGLIAATGIGQIASL